MQARRRDATLAATTALAVLAVTALAAWLALDEVNLSTRNSPLGQTIANITLVVGIAGALAPLAQVRRIVQTQSSNDVSLLFVALYATTYVLGVATGVVLLMPAYYVPGAIGTATAATLLLTTLRVRWTYRNWDEMSALRHEDAAQGALVELDHEADTPATVFDPDMFDDTDPEG